MIITRTPFRVSFCGGGTDLPEYYRIAGGCVTSVAIDKYMNIIVNKRFDESIRVSYSRTEIVRDVDEIQHPIVREAMKLTGVTRGVEIVSVADIPAGAGLGSSSSFAVGLLHALYAYQGILKSAAALAEEACHIEIHILGAPIGKQDQYIAAYGGLRFIRFSPDDRVFVEYILCSRELRAALQDNLLMFYIGSNREARDILSEQKANIDNHKAILDRMRDLAGDLRDCLNQGKELDRVGEIMHEGWCLKKQLALGISNPMIDEWYERARRAGASGGKVLGAGGRGFLLLYCPSRYQPRVLDNLRELRPISFRFEPEGSKIIYMTGE